MVTRAPVKTVGVVILLTFLTSPDLGYTKALSFDPKRLESSSQMWSSDYRQVLLPSFDDTPQNVTALVGDSAFLPCAVVHLGDRSVTWMRKRDLHILTAGVYTYSADERFRVLHPENSDDWTLHIKFVTLRDAGVYECQVNSDPKISRKVTLTIRDSQLDDPQPYGRATTDITPQVSMEGPSERHIQQGSVLAITCVVRHPPRASPDHILWFHGTTNIDYDSTRGGVSIQTEKKSRMTVSKLMLSAVDRGDTGEYSCSPTDLQPAVVTVHVQDGQNQQPVKVGPGLSGASVTASASSSVSLVFLVVLLAFARHHMFA